MTTEPPTKKPGSPKGVKKPRQVLGHQTRMVNGAVYHFAFKPDGLHSWPKFSKVNKQGANPKELVLGFGDLIHPAHTLAIDSNTYTFKLNATGVTISRAHLSKVFSFQDLVDQFEGQYRLPLETPQDPEVEALQKLAKG